MDEGHQPDLPALLRARLAAAGFDPPPDTTQLERDLELHLERVAALAAAADLHPSDPPFPGPALSPGADIGAPGGKRSQPASGAPAVVHTPPLDHGGLGELARRVRDGEVTSAALVERTLGRIAEPDEIAEVICFLAHERASFVTGGVYTVDGGLLTLLGGAPRTEG